MIRPAAAGDASSIARIIVDAWQTAYSGVIDECYPAGLSVEKYTSIFAEVISESTQIVFVYEENGEVLGFASGVMPASEYDCEVKGLYVAPSQQGRGIGSQLLEFMSSYFRSADCSTMIIWTLLGVKNNGFYIAVGGVDYQRKVIEIGKKNYSGVGYLFNLKNT